MDRDVTISIFEYDIGVIVDQIPEEEEKLYPSIGFAVSYRLQYYYHCTTSALTYFIV